MVEEDTHLGSLYQDVILLKRRETEDLVSSWVKKLANFLTLIFQDVTSLTRYNLVHY